MLNLRALDVAITVTEDAAFVDRVCFLKIVVVTHLWRMDFPILINWMSPLSF